MQQLHLSIPYDYQKIKVAQNVLKLILVLDFLKCGEVLGLEKFCNYLQASKQPTNQPYSQIPKREDKSLRYLETVRLKSSLS